METFLSTMDRLHKDHAGLMGKTYAFLGGTSLALMSIFMRLVDKNLHFVSIICIQNAVGAFVSLLVVGWLFNFSAYHPSKAITMNLFHRGFWGALTYILYNYALRMLPPQKFIVLSNTQSIWVVVLSPFFLNEYPNKTVVFLLLLSLTGVLIMVDPALILPDTWVYPDGVDNRPPAEYPWYLLVAPVCTAFVGAGISIFVKFFAKELNPFHNVAYFFFFNSFYSGVTANLVEVPPERSGVGLESLFFILMVAVSQMGYQVLITLASRYEKRASFIAIIGNCQIPIAYVLDFLVLSGKIELLNVVGGLIIIVTTSLIAVSKESPAAPQVEPQPQEVKP